MSDFYPRYYRRDGTAFPEGEGGLFEWAKAFEDFNARIVRQETLPNGYFVSTVWLGLNHNWGSGPPLIFETMVQDSEGTFEDYQERYSAEDEAILGHLRAVDEFLKR